MTTRFTDHDHEMMRKALSLGLAQLGKTAPNPAVGCVIVKDGEVVGAGATGEGGQPHAEETALEIAGDRARGATAYVTLEPCHSRSSGAPGCSDRLIDAGVVRVVAALEDPHPTAMDGFAKLRAAGLQVDVGLDSQATEILVEGFFHRLDTGRPLVVLDDDASRYDCMLELNEGESLEAALDRLGESGMTRIYVRPGTREASLLRARRLIDKTVA